MNAGLVHMVDKQYILFPDPSGQGSAGLSASETIAEMIVRGNKLTRQPIDVFTPAGDSNDDLYGSWVTTKQAYHFLDGQVRYVGREQNRYTFTRGSSEYLFEKRYLDDAPWPNVSGTSGFHYSPPLLASTTI